jgi:ABC-2 type transport system permease protein
MASALSGNNPLKSMPHIGGLVYFCFAVFFLLGFLVYATLFAASGAIVSSEQESQQTQLPITLLLVLSFVLAPMVLNAPGGVMAVVLSLIPFFSPVLMTMRVIVSSPPLWQILLAIVLSAATVLGVVRVTAKIYRLGILMTGKRPTLPELLRWLRYT